MRKYKKKRVRFKNENLTSIYLEDLLGFAPTKQYYIREKIVFNNETIRKFIICDFYFKHPDTGQPFIVEYNGSQHYQTKKYKQAWRQKRAQNVLRKQMLRDQWLEQYCLKHNIILINIDGRIYKGNKILKYLEVVLDKYW